MPSIGRPAGSHGGRCPGLSPPTVELSRHRYQAGPEQRRPIVDDHEHRAGGDQGRCIGSGQAFPEGHDREATGAEEEARNARRAAPEATTIGRSTSLPRAERLGMRASGPATVDRPGPGR
jgi:hypothetical protein